MVKLVPASPLVTDAEFVRCLWIAIPPKTPTMSRSRERTMRAGHFCTEAVVALPTVRVSYSPDRWWRLRRRSSHRNPRFG
jgi:hypothetical protein